METRLTLDQKIIGSTPIKTTKYFFISLHFAYVRYIYIHKQIDKK